MEHFPYLTKMLSSSELEDDVGGTSPPVEASSKLSVPVPGTGGWGNTNPIPRGAKHRSYCITVNNWTANDLEILDRNTKTAKYFIIGKEVGESGTPHLQAYLNFKSPRSWAALKKAMPSAHIEVAKGTPKQNYEYCSKEGDFRTNMNQFEDFKKKMKRLCLDEYKDVEWKPWQQQVIDIITGVPCKRTIHWFWEPTGNVGKSFLCKYLAIKFGVIICEGKKTDIFNQVLMALEAKKEIKIVLLDVPRTSADYINYGAIEGLKNGMLYSGKYEGGQCIFPSPHVIAFANTEPNKAAMSGDRWNVVEIIPTYRDIREDDTGGACIIQGELCPTGVILPAYP